MSVHGGPNTIKNGLVLHLDASNNRSYPGTGTTWFDLSGNNNHGTLTNMSVPSCYVRTYGGRALDFDGSNDYADILDSPSLNPTKQITVCCWYYSRGLPSSGFPFNYCLLGKSSSVNAQPYPAFDIRGSSASTLELAIAIGVTSRQVSLGAINTNTWTFIAATYNGAVLAGYRNGVLVQSSSQSGDIGTTTNPLRFGDNPGFPSRFYNGQLDDVRLYNRALTPSEIRQNYNATRGRFGL